MLLKFAVDLLFVLVYNKDRVVSVPNRMIEGGNEDEGYQLGKKVDE